MENSDKGRKPPASFIIGAIALVFLIVGYQSALFIHKASVMRLIANHDEPDTIYVYEEVPEHPEAVGSSYRSGEDDTAEGVMRHGPDNFNGQLRRQDSRSSQPGSRTVGRKAEGGSGKSDTENGRRIVRKESAHSPEAESIRLNYTERKYESFPFDPNTASVEELMRLGFSVKQAQSIDNYRKKGGRFRRKEDFAKSYVVADTVYKRLEPFIDIPKIELNSADSAAFETLPGIGKFFASRMVSYREELGGYSYPEQLMDIWKFDKEKYDSLKDLIFIDLEARKPYPLWSLPEEELVKHPYIDRYAAHGIVLFRQNTPQTQWSVENLAKAGVLDKAAAEKLSRCLIGK